MNILQKALIEAIQESMGITLNKDKKILKRAFFAKITLENHIFAIAVNRALLEKFALDFLEIAKPDRAVLIDITKEIANLVLGKAKVLYEENGDVLKLGIPEFMGYREIKDFYKAFGYHYGQMRCSIYEVNNNGK